MTTRDLFEETYAALSANKARSSLTILGIVIGISSVIALVAVGTGASASISASIQSLGSNLIEVMPGAAKSVGFGASAGRGSAKSLTQADAAAIQAQVQNVMNVAGEYTGRYQVAVAGANTNTSVDGVSASYATIRDVSIDQGRFVTDVDSTSLSKVAVLGPTVVTDLFGANAVASDALGQKIRINNLQFTVVGVTVSKGSSGFNNQDDMIYIPLGTALQYFAGNGNQYLSTIDIQAASSDAMTQVQNDITSLLLARHNISNPTLADFSILNLADIVSAASSVTGTFTILLAAIAGISLLVGGIGIMNMMLTTVSERMREIGLRKAIGATRHDINMQFLRRGHRAHRRGRDYRHRARLGARGGRYLNRYRLRLGDALIGLLSFGVSAAIGIAFG